MAEQLTELQLRIIRALRKHKKKDTSRIFSMDQFYNTLPLEVEKSRFREDVDILEGDSYIVKLSEKFGEIGGYDITTKGLKHLRENMDRADECKKKLATFLNELEEIERTALGSGEYRMGRERTARWKDRVVRYLRTSMADAEADRLETKQSALYAGNPQKSLTETMDQYKDHISVLIEEIDEDPTGIFQKPPAAETIRNQKPATTGGRGVFVVHGRDQGVKHEVARFLERLGLKPIILHEQPSKGRTIIEKFEDYSDVAYAVVLLTADDIGKLASEETEPRPRARQNVVFELGFFIGNLGRKRVCTLYQEGLELPSDYKGVVYVPLDPRGAWKLQLGGELKAAGLEVDMDKAV